MEIAILHQTVTGHDAIGNEIATMHRLISGRLPCRIYCTAHPHNTLPLLSRKELLELLQDENNVIIYHHSNFWMEGRELLESAKCRVIIRYHNVTPGEFYEPYDSQSALACALGRQQTHTMAASIPGALWMCASRRNLDEIAGTLNGSCSAVVVPPLHTIDVWAGVSPDEQLLKQLLEASRINLLFVGRVVPNKNHVFLIDSLHWYKTYFDSRITLWLAGKKQPSLAGYYRELESAISCYGLDSHVVFLDECTEQQLLACYLGADFFVCASRHEGFCLPLIEAQALRLPVISTAAPALADTLGQNQLLLDSDPLCFAAAIAELKENEQWAEFLIDAGLRNYRSRFATAVLEEHFVQALFNFAGHRP